MGLFFIKLINFLRGHNVKAYNKLLKNIINLFIKLLNSPIYKVFLKVIKNNPYYNSYKWSLIL